VERRTAACPRAPREGVEGPGCCRRASSGSRLPYRYQGGQSTERRGEEHGTEAPLRPLRSNPRSRELLGTESQTLPARSTPAMPVMPASQSEITSLVLDWSAGDQDAFDRLVPLIYDDLRRIAHNHLGRNRRGDTLNTTAVVHELYLDLVDQTRVGWRDRVHFFAVASKVMRHIVIDAVRRKSAQKRGGDRVRVPLLPDKIPVDGGTPDLLALDQALDRLAEHDPRLGQVVECRFFGGMTAKETAEALGVGVRTVERDWTRARTYLYRALSDDPAGPS